MGKTRIVTVRIPAVDMRKWLKSRNHLNIEGKNKYDEKLKQRNENKKTYKINKTSYSFFRILTLIKLTTFNCRVL